MLTASGDGTDVVVTTDLQITGKPAQFGRGVMVEVGNKLLGRFADCLADELSGGQPAAAAPAAASGASAPGTPALLRARRTARRLPRPGTSRRSTSAPGPQATTRPPPLRRLPDDDAIDLLGTAGGPVLKRLVPVVGALVLLLVLWRLSRRRR